MVKLILYQTKSIQNSLILIDGMRDPKNNIWKLSLFS